MSSPILMSRSNYAKLYYPHVEGKLIAISFITVGELYFGAYRKTGERSDWQISRIDLDRRRSFRLMRAYAEPTLKSKRRWNLRASRVSANDLWIAACAVRHGIPLVTNNRRDFDGIPGLVVRSESQAMREMQSQVSISADATTAPSDQPQPSSKSSSRSEEKARRPWIRDPAVNLALSVN
jgi:predicted nucleic acid-binding protein